MIKRLFSKILVLAFILSVNFIGATNAYLSDMEHSNGNSFTAGSVDLSLKDAGGVVLSSPLFNISGMKPGDSETKTVKVTKEGTLDFQYSLKATKTGGDDVLCNALKIEAKLDSVSQYNASLTGLNLNPAATITGGEDVWDFTVKLDNPDSGLQEKSCAFDIEIKGWQIGSDGTWGLTDDESLTNIVTTACWVAPTIPVLSSPANGFYSTNPDQTFVWDSSSSTCPSVTTIQYQYEAYTNSGMTGTPYYDSGWIDPIIVALTGMDENTYYWHVRAKDQYGNTSSFNTPWSLVIPHVVTVRLFPTADARINQENPTNNTGASDYLTVKSYGGNRDVRSLLRFDLATLPFTSQISGAFLNLYLFDAPPSSRINEVYLVTDHSNDWVEGDNNGTPADLGEVAWNWYANPNAWTSGGGGDFNSVPTDSVTTGIANNVWKTWDVTSDITSLILYSWIIKDSIEGSTTEQKARYYSKEETSINHDPYIDITFGAPAMTTGYLVVNEVYYDVASAKGAENTNEWVEIYNPSDVGIDISGWSICDNTSCSLIPTTTPIPSHGFAVITPNISTWGYWSIPSEAIEIVLGTNIGNRLNNTGDRIILKDSSSAIIDQMSYGTDTTVFNLPYVREGWSLARLIKGFDDDSASNFWANPNPNPGTNPDKNEVCLDLSSSDDKRSVGFKIYGETLSQFESMEYTMTYDAEQGQQGVKGTRNIEGKNEILVDNILLGSCSSGGTCVYHSGVTKVALEVILKGPVEKTLSKEISL